MKEKERRARETHIPEKPREAIPLDLLGVIGIQFLGQLKKLHPGQFIPQLGLGQQARDAGLQLWELVRCADAVEFCELFGRAHYYFVFGGGVGCWGRCIGIVGGVGGSWRGGDVEKHLSAVEILQQRGEMGDFLVREEKRGLCAAFLA